MLDIIEHGQVREIRMARPPVNALSPELVSRLAMALRDAASDSDAVVLSGLPGVFSAGLDVMELLPLDLHAMGEFWQAFFALLETIATSPVPVASAITGHAPAGGALISMMTDYRVMCRGNYRIGLNETKVGLVVAPILHDTMTWMVGPRVAERMIVAGSLVKPEDALEAGLLDAVADGFDATADHALGWCRDVLALPRQAMLGNRAIARARYREAFKLRGRAGAEAMTKAWFADETQVELQRLVARLKGGA